MTKRWSSTRSDLTKTKRQASKDRRRETYDPDGDVPSELQEEAELIANWDKD